MTGSSPYRHLRCVFLGLLAIAGLACQGRGSHDTKRDPAVLDGMELAAAKRVGLESAADALRRGDLKQLKMLSVWARTRAQVVLLAPADLESLDRAIACLEQDSTRASQLAALAALETGTLRAPARELCQRDPESKESE
jgi:hypothetical protein